jgi:hypothetical protein
MYAMLVGDYDIDEKLDFFHIFITLVYTLFPNVVLLNLIIAIIGETYEETITSIDEKCLKE